MHTYIWHIHKVYFLCIFMCICNLFKQIYTRNQTAYTLDITRLSTAAFLHYQYLRLCYKKKWWGHWKSWWKFFIVVAVTKHFILKSLAESDWTLCKVSLNTCWIRVINNKSVLPLLLYDLIDNFFFYTKYTALIKK